MTYKESDIVHEAGRFWVLREARRGRYTVFVTGVTHSASDSAYALTPDGLSLAIARCDYLHRNDATVYR